MSDFFDSKFGDAGRWPNWWQRRLEDARDLLADAHIALSPTMSRLRREARRGPRWRVLVVGVRVPDRGDALRQITDSLAASRHHVDISTVAMAPVGKFDNIAAAIAAAPEGVETYDWLVVVDDDVALPAGFLDTYLHVADRAGLTVSQPAHRLRSFAMYAPTQRRHGSIARRTGFVEIGPLTVIHREAFRDLLPFPASRWCFGIDVLWSDIARRRGWTIGIVDALAVRHLKPVGGGYSLEAALAEGRALLRDRGVTIGRAEVFGAMDQGALRARLRSR